MAQFDDRFSGRPFLGRRLRLTLLLAALVASAWLAGIGYLGTWRLDLMTQRHVAAAADEVTAIARADAVLVERRMEVMRAVPLLLAGQASFGRDLARFGELAAAFPRSRWRDLLRGSDLERLSAELAAFSADLGLDGIYLATPEGFVVASSDIGAEGTRLGASFARRVHFEKAIATGVGEHFGVDPVTGEPMFYFARSVTHGGRIVGAVMTAMSSVGFADFLRRGDELVLLADANGVVVVSSEPLWLFRAMDASRPPGVAPEIAELVYGTSTFTPMPDGFFASQVDDVVEAGSIHAAAEVAGEGLMVNVVSPLPDLAVVRRENLIVVAGLALFGLLLTAVVTLAILQIGAFRERAIRDPLTGLSNRRYADEVLPGLIELDHRGRLAGIALVAFDLDRFKGINDTWGHLVGDRVLRRVAQIMLRSARRTDLVFRLGGEEFVTVLIERDIAGALVYAERVRAATAQIDDIAPIPRGRITLSAGVVKRAPGEGLDAMMARADALLYLAKQNGRDRIEVEEATG